MKSLQEFITESEQITENNSSEDVYVVYMGDGTMENFYYSENEEEYTYKELLELIEKGETMLIVINK